MTTPKTANPPRLRRSSAALASWGKRLAVAFAVAAAGACGGGADDVVAEGSTGSGGASSSAAGSGGSTTSAGGSATGGGGSSSFEAVWPGTTTRFFPGIYFGAGRNGEPGKCTQVFDEAFGPNDRGESWRAEDERGNKITFLGCFMTIDVRRLYVDESLAPHAYDQDCARSSTAQDPGWSNYDWAYIESFFDEPFIADEGGKLYLQLDDIYGGNPLPQWMDAQGLGYANQGAAALWRQKTTNALMDVLQAFATRFAGDDRIAAVMLTETYRQSDPMPDDFFGSEPACGNVDGLTSISAKRQGRIYEAVALKDGDPDLMVIVMNLTPAMEDGHGASSPGMNDLPGQWGAASNGAQLFVGGCGSGTHGDVDCDQGAHSGFWAVQKYGVTGSHAASVDTQSNEWTISNDSCCRLDDENPWGDDPWSYVSGYWPGQGGEWKNQPTPSQWVWYYSGEPRNPSDDSALGQSGRDPGGVSPVSYFVCRNLPGPVMQASESDDTRVDTRTYENFAEAFDTFGPPGTGAMFRLPEGYR